MKIINKNSIIVLIILIIALVIRVYRINSLPPALSPDEAALGYNAYSILKTGRDEFGQLLPIIFKSFGDYKPGLYVYLAIPSVLVFGLTEFAVRLPSVIAGIGIVYLTYLTTMLLFDNNKLLSRLVSFSAAVNPWLIFYSRGAWESNVSLMFTLLGMYFFLKTRENGRFILPSMLSFVVTLVTYQGAKLSTAIVVLLLVFLYWREFVNTIRSNIKYFIAGILCSLVISFPVIKSFQGQTGRLKVFSVFSYPRPAEYISKFIKEAGVAKDSFVYKMYYSEPLNFTRGILGRWSNHFSGRFLFFEGDYQNPRHSSPNHGMLLLTDMLLLVFGTVYIIKSQKINSKVKILLFLWLVLSPLPSVLSRDQVQSVRALNMAIPLVFLSGVGFYSVLNGIANLKNSNIAYISFIFIYSLSALYFLDSYFVHYGVHNAKYVPYGFKEMVYKVESIRSGYERVVVEQSYSQPYMYFLFYGSSINSDAYNPETYQKRNSFVDGGIDVGTVKKLNNIDFVDFSWPYANGEPGTLIVGSNIVVPADYNKASYNFVWEIKYPDGFATALRMVETK